MTKNINKKDKNTNIKISKPGKYIFVFLFILLLSVILFVKFLKFIYIKPLMVTQEIKEKNSSSINQTDLSKFEEVKDNVNTPQQLNSDTIKEIDSILNQIDNDPQVNLNDIEI